MWQLSNSLYCGWRLIEILDPRLLSKTTARFIVSGIIRNLKQVMDGGGGVAEIRSP